MKNKNRWLLSLLIVLVLLSIIGAPASAYLPSFTSDASDKVQESRADHIDLISQGNDGVSFMLSVPWQQLQFESINVEGRVYQEVSLAGWQKLSLAGLPQLPFMTVQFGAPLGVEVEVKVTPGKMHSFKLSAPVMPSPTQTISNEFEIDPDKLLPFPTPLTQISEDQKIYGGSGSYPSDLAELSSDGMLRQQRVLGLNIYPVQYDPDQLVLKTFETLTVMISFKGQPKISEHVLPLESVVYEEIFSRSLLNYDTARKWRSVNAVLDMDSIDSTIPWQTPDPGWKVEINQDGIYKLSYLELQNAGLLVDSLDPHTFQMFYMGQEIAIWVEGEADSGFEADDYILFYGQGIKSKYASNNVYWLTYENVPQGLRMTPKDGTPLVAHTPISFLDHLHLEGNAFYLSQIPGDEDLDRWMWHNFYATSSNPVIRQYEFYLNAPAVTDPAVLTAAFMGYLQNPVTPDHHVLVKINGVQIGDAWWDGLTWHILEMQIPENVLSVGLNTIEITAPNDSGIGVEYFFLDWLELQFSNTFTASDGSLKFSNPMPDVWKYSSTNFSSDLIKVFDVTDPWHVQNVINTLIIPEGSGYEIQFQDTVLDESAYWLVEDLACRSVLGIEQDSPSDLFALSNAADHITIYHSFFEDQAQLLRDFRESNGLRAVSVDLQDIYDEFGYGIPGVKPIHDFLSYAYASWQAPAPSYVVLLGDGHYDPKNYAYTKENFISPYLAPVDPWIRETAADNRFVTIVGEDTLPDMMLGRLAVNSITEADAFVQKIIRYEQNLVPGEWQENILTVADNADSGGNFALFSDELINCCLPEPYVATKVHYLVTHLTVSEARTAILTGINAGKLLVNYIGHGTYKQWANEGFFKASDVAGLTNGDKLPIFLAMTCYDGFYHYPLAQSLNYESTAEVVTRADGKGAIASWSATGLGIATGHDYLNRGFFNAIFTGHLNTLGQAAATGILNLWSTGNNLDLIDTYLVFGDPATFISRPVNAFDDEFSTEEDTPLDVAAPGVLVNDNGIDPITAELEVGPQNGDLVMNPDGSFVYTPDPDYFGFDSFTYKATDGEFQSNLAVVSISINAINDAPVVTDIPDQTIAISENFTALALDNYVLDVDNETADLVWTFAGNTELIVNIIDRVATVSKPHEDWVGSESITFKVTDLEGLWGEDAATFTVTEESLLMIFLPLVNK